MVALGRGGISYGRGTPVQDLQAPSGLPGRARLDPVQLCNTLDFAVAWMSNSGVLVLFILLLLLYYSRA